MPPPSPAARRCFPPSGVLAAVALAAGLALAPGAAGAGAAQQRVQVHQTKVPTGYSATSLVCTSARACLVTLTTANLRVAVGISTDGGTRWRIVRLPASLLGLSSLSCADPLHCVAAGTTATPGTIRQSPVFVTTADGGATWLVHPIPAAFGITGLYSIACTSASSCLAVTIDLRQLTHLLVSTDGGAIWTKRPAPLKDLRGVACRRGGRCVLYAGGYADTGPESEKVVSSGDGGAHWGAVATFKGVETIQAAACPSVRACVLVGGTISQAEPNAGNGVVLRTTDGGSTWSRGTVPSNMATLSDVSCGDASHCVLVGYTHAGPPVVTRLLASADAGARWSALPAQVSGGVSGLACSSARSCVAVGS
ncbi:MAG TPA: hypothetical protein VMU75_12785 [Acidimicrobiales bacterium]|nr:hypothetical protein [Acidimicrobiales bacterium]